MKKFNKLAAVAGVLAGIALMQPVQAVVIHGVGTGSVVSGWSDAGNAMWGFDNYTTFAGQAFNVDFTYDTAIAPLDYDASSSIGHYVEDISSANAGWLVMNLTINGTTHSFDGMRVGKSGLHLFDQTWSGADHYALISNAGTTDFMDLSATSSVVDFINGDDLNQIFNLSGGSSILEGSFQIGSILQDYATGDLSFRNLSLSIVPGTVPEPGVLWLICIGMASIVILRRQKSRTISESLAA